MAGGLLLCALFVLALAAPAAAESTWQFQTAGERKAADIGSWVTLGAAWALDTKASWNAPNRMQALELEATRIGITYAAVGLAKLLIHRARPCAPECGSDNPQQSFFSGHAAGAFETLGGPSLAISLPLAIGTGGQRIVAGKHWPSDVLVGALVGALASRIR